MWPRRVQAQPRKNGPEGWVGPRRVGPRRVGGPKFRVFFPSPATISLFLCLSGCLLVEFWWCLKRRSPSMCPFGVLGLSCEAPAAPKRSSKTPPKFNEKRRHPERHKKSEILGGPAEGGSSGGGSGGRWSTEVQTSNNHNNAKPRTSGARRAGPLSQARFRVWVFRSWAQQHDNNTTKYNKTTQQQQQKQHKQHNNTTTTTTTPENFAKTLRH